MARLRSREGLSTLAAIETHIERGRAPTATSRHRRLTIIAQDPSVCREGRILTADVTVPVDRLEPGPRSHRFHVVDFDATAGRLLDPVADLCDPDADELERHWTCRDRFAPPEDPDEKTVRAYNATLLADPAFRAQNVYAIASRTLAAFEFALGRRLDWAFDSHQLYLVPKAFAEANAHYSREDRGVFFGYLPCEDGRIIHTCLSHDIVCHETTHAILDGLRPRFVEPALPDQAAFHEALGDLVAILSVCGLPEAVELALGKADPEGRISTQSFDQAVATGVLFAVAEEFGEAVKGVRGSALRRSQELTAGDQWRTDVAYEEPHRRGEVIVAAVIDALAGMWKRRLEALVHDESVNLRRAAEEGARAASHLLTMIIRSLDYAPAVELDFEDVLDAILTADEVVAPDDPHRYRDEVRKSFGRYGIHTPPGRMIDVSKLAVPFRYDQINALALRSTRQEAYRFIWQNLHALGLKSKWHLQVEALQPALRVGPDGLVIQEIVCDYVQVLELTAGQARAMRHDGADGLAMPDEKRLPDHVPLQLWGGGTLIFDQFGRLKLHQRKALDDWARQSRRVRYLVRKGLFDTRGRLGYSTGAAAGMAFADLHASAAGAGEAW